VATVIVIKARAAGDMLFGFAAIPAVTSAWVGVVAAAPAAAVVVVPLIV